MADKIVVGYNECDEIVRLLVRYVYVDQELPNLARALGIYHSLMAAFGDNMFSDDADSANIQRLMEKWVLQEGKNARLKSVLNALRSIRRGDIADELESHFVPKEESVPQVQAGPSSSTQPQSQINLASKTLSEIVVILNNDWNAALEYHGDPPIKASDINLPKVVRPDSDMPFPDDNHKLPRAESKGLFLIVNILHVDGQEYRSNAILDTIHLSTIFTSLGYRIFNCPMRSIYWTRKVFFNTFRAFERECYKQRVHSLGVFLGSHGRSGKLSLYDDEVYIDEVMNHLFSRLDKIPKMVFVQVCRQGNHCPDVTDSFMKTSLVSYACRSGQKAYRNKEGSVYVKHLVQNLANFASTEDLLRILERTKLDVSSEVRRDLSDEQEPEHFEYNLGKLYFNVACNVH